MWSGTSIETWTANSGTAVCCLCSLSQQWKLTQHAESIGFYMEIMHTSVSKKPSLCVLASCRTMMERCMISMWKWVLAGWVFLCASEDLMCANMAPCQCLHWDLHHGTRLMSLTAKIPKWKCSIQNGPIKIDTDIWKAVLIKDGKLRCLIFSGKHWLEDWIKYTWLDVHTLGSAVHKQFNSTVRMPPILV